MWALHLNLFFKMYLVKITVHVFLQERVNFSWGSVLNFWDFKLKLFLFFTHCVRNVPTQMYVRIVSAFLDVLHKQQYLFCCQVEAFVNEKL